MREEYECDTEVNLCYSNPCGNHGTCMRREGGYTCVCLPEFTGASVLTHDRLIKIMYLWELITLMN